MDGFPIHARERVASAEHLPLPCTMASFATSVLQKMLLESPSDEHFDVKLIVESGENGNGQETVLRAHRIVLSTVSEVFRKMFASGLREHNEGVVRVPDFTPAALAESLALIYGGELNAAKRDWQLAGQVWDFGHRFKIEHVASLARTAALEQLAQENCLRMLGFSLYINDDEAVGRIRDFVSDENNFADVVQSAEFALSSYETVSAVRRPPAGSYLEPDVTTFEKVWFDSLVAWADAVSGEKDEETRDSKREVRLQRAMRLVDFNRMRTHELRECRSNKVAGASAALATALVGVLLARCEKMEQSVTEKERELDDLGAAYQVALLGKNEAERTARIADERFQKATSGRLSRDDIKNVRGSRGVRSPVNSADALSDSMFMNSMERLSVGAGNPPPAPTPAQYSSSSRRGSSRQIGHPVA